ncbi:MAG: phenylalanine--tRNA ligase subunit beta, partial [Candidatus Omnitrophica bacterium]|nr:phenylalanine--tRNA ligase subunit beta [Candidatus Omnitrophota bacterium]
EIEVTSNRPDCLSYIGIAREVAALTGRKLKIPSVKILQTPNRKARIPITIRVEDKKLCPRYTGRVINDVKVGESPAWLKTRIEAMGLRPVNNIVDITNFCLFETGEPMHAFDVDKIHGEVIIRKARKAEKIVTIDGIERVLNESDLVIADKERPIAIAGVMGGLNTEVTGKTKNILLEAAYFDPVSVRRTSRRLGVSTESSYRFERRVDLENIAYSSNRTVELITKMAGGEIGKFINIGRKTGEAKTVSLRYSRLNKILGLDIEPVEIKRISNSLGLNTKKAAKERIELKIPSYRYDLQDEIDIIEEVSRIYGYDKIPQTIPNIVEGASREDQNRIIEKRVREGLTGLGLDEIITYGLLSNKLLNMSGVSDTNVVEIRNPLSSEQALMRPSLITGMLNTMIWNINRKTEDLKLFELGKVYFKKPDQGFIEIRHLCIGITGQIYSGWDGHVRTAWFADLMGMLETLLSEFGIGPFSYSMKEVQDGRYSSGTCASIGIKGDVIGIAGEIAPEILNNFDIKDDVYTLEIDIDALRKHISSEKHFKTLPKYPSVLRDISVIISKEVLNAQVLSLIMETGGPVLSDVKLIDRYVGKQVPDGKVSLTYRLEYQDLQKTLEEKNISQVHFKILQALESKFGARLR